MAGLFNILKVTVSEDKICAHVLVNPGMPLMTSEDIEATARVYYLVPAIAKHLCLGDSGREFQDCMGQTELCHLLEHVTVELMNETGLAGSISCGRTRVSEHDERVFEVKLSCPDDALAIGALSSATFMMDWAYLHADQPAPDVEGTVAGLRNLVLGMRAEAEGKDPHEAVAAANGEDAAEDEGADEGADEGDAPVDAEPVSDATAESVPTEPQGVPNLTTSPRWRLIPRRGCREPRGLRCRLWRCGNGSGRTRARGQPAARGRLRRGPCRHGGHAGPAAGVSSRVYRRRLPALLPYADERGGKRCAAGIMDSIQTVGTEVPAGEE
ncbi:MAG: cyanophycin synthetase family protein [Collinsella sp.]